MKEAEVREMTLEYFGGDELAADVFFKYALRNSEGEYMEATPDDMHRLRLAPEFARIEAKYPNPVDSGKIYSKLKNFSKIVPQGSPMYGIGNDYKLVSLSNCVVVEAPDDTMTSILEQGKSLANLMKRRCGVGIDISTLRPEGAPVNNAARTSSGAWTFADFFSYVTRMVGQSGRRGALMITMDVRHPDIEKFATMKMDKTKVTGANVSIKITDEFMEAVNKGETFQLRFPVDSEEPTYTKEVNAKELWDLVVKTARDSAEPGLMMWDNITKTLPAHCYPFFKTITTNPCVTKDTWIQTDTGALKVGDLIGDQFVAHVDGVNWPSTEKGFWSTGVKPVYELETKKGYKLRLTSNHKIKKATHKTRNKIDYEWTPLKDVKPGDRIILSNQRESGWHNPNGSFEEGRLLGSLVGGGTFNGDKYALISFWGDDKESLVESAKSYFETATLSFVGPRYDEKADKLTLASKDLIDLARSYGITKGSKIPSEMLEMASMSFYKGYLSSIFDVGGSVQDSQDKGVSIRLSQSNLPILEQVQRMLHRLGIVSTIYKEGRPEGHKDLPDDKGDLKEYLYKAQHDLVISNDNMLLFRDKVGFVERSKQTLLEAKLNCYKRNLSRERFTDEIVSITYQGEEEVFDATIPEVHQFDANGIAAHNCGEIPLSAGDSCRLISINLYEHVKDKFKEECYFDFEEFRETVRLAQRMADDLVDLEIEKLTQIMEECDTDAERDLFGKLLEAAERGRRTGLGTHGLGDCLAALRLRYDSDEAVEMVSKIYEEFKIAAYSESVNLAKERGAFPDFNWELEKDCEFFDSFPEWLIEEMKVYGRRNISLLTCAPTGSVSIESQVSSGVEPIFRLFYTRRKKINHNENVEPDFIDKLGDKWKEYRVYHKSVKDAMSVLGTEEIPEWFIESDDIDWIKRVAIQSAMQAHIDHSISSTINLPSDVQADEVGKIYFEGWRQGLKGLTVYREGSRDGVLVSDDVSDSGFTHRDAAKRPEEIPCDIHHVHVKGEKWVIIVGLVDGKPYEVFGGRAEKIELDKSIDSGILTKKKFTTVPNRYSLDAGVVKINDIIKAFDNPDNGTMTRMLSLALRHGTRPNYIVEQIQKDKNESFASFSKVVARVLKTYIEDGQKASIVNRNCETQENCNFVYQEGCATCVQCGWAKCG